MKILRAFQVINQDGGYIVSSTYNEADNLGNIEKRNVKDSFFAVDEELIAHIEAIQKYIKEKRLGQG